MKFVFLLTRIVIAPFFIISYFGIMWFPPNDFDGVLQVLSLCSVFFILIFPRKLYLNGWALSAVLLFIFIWILAILRNSMLNNGVPIFDITFAAFVGIFIYEVWILRNKDNTVGDDSL